ncbi:MAG: TetR/AcrR family transcriptional regulator, partial [Chloroflexota bacterium]|nr:TetR/AcrR family transcriptional regulator [Chloroflexota bacterium]
YNAFSYADIANQIGITKASIHYYFPSKDALCQEVVRRYRATQQSRLVQIDQQTAGAREKLELYIHLYADILQDPDRLCVCGMLACDSLTLSNELRLEVQHYFTSHEEWLINVFTQGVQTGVVRITGSVEHEAHLWVATLQGALLMAHAFQEVSRYHMVTQQLLQGLLAK